MWIGGLILACSLQTEPPAEFDALVQGSPLAEQATKECPTVYESLWNTDDGVMINWTGEVHAAKRPLMRAEHQRALESEELGPRIVTWNDEVYARLPHAWRFSVPDDFARIHVAGMWTGGKTATYSVRGREVSVLYGSSPSLRSRWQSIGIASKRVESDPYILSLVRAQPEARSFAFQLSAVHACGVPAKDILKVDDVAESISFAQSVPVRNEEAFVKPVLSWPDGVFDGVLTVHDSHDKMKVLTTILVSRPYDKLEEGLAWIVDDSKFCDPDAWPIAELRDIPIERLLGEVRWIRRPSQAAAATPTTATPSASGSAP